jgi:hypothetical protein
MVELVYTLVLEASAERLAGSSPVLGTIFNILLKTHTLFLSLPAFRPFGRKRVPLAGVGF